MKPKRLYFSCFLSSSLLLTSCVRNPPISGTAIEGNWHVVGGENQSQYPFLTLTLVVNGNMLYGSGNVGVSCASSDLPQIRAGFSFTGQIGSDGSFTLSNSSLGSLQIAIRGKVPAAGSTTWAGTFSISNSPTQTSCILNESGDFVASLYPPLSGTYAGKIVGQGFGSGITLVTQVTQGPLSLTPVPGGSSLAIPLYIPLSATVSVSGSPCFSTGTSAPLTMAPSTLNGDSFLLSYAMNDGSNLQLQGWFTDSSESTLQVQTGGVVGVPGITGGNCGGAIGTGVLTRE